MRNLDEVFAALAKSRFRCRFTLSAADRAYVDRKTFKRILKHARDFVHERLAPEDPPNDGRQTPMQGHPVFLAQHATGTCCRKCLFRWHGINAGKRLTDSDMDYIVAVIQRWLSLQLQEFSSWESRQLRLFEEGND